MGRITDRKRKSLTIAKGILFALIIIGLPLYIYVFHHDLIEIFKNVENIEDYILEHKQYGALIYITAQVIQIIISVIPGQPFQFAAGYVYGAGIALVLSITGAFIGATITFFLSKLLGRDAMELFFGRTRAFEYIERLDSRNGYLILFLLYFIPGFPKDAISYIAGLSRIKWLPFILIVTTARIPAMLGSIFVGTFTESQQYYAVVIVAVIVILISVLSYRNKEKILDLGDRIYEKLRRL